MADLKRSGRISRRLHFDSDGIAIARRWAQAWAAALLDGCNYQMLVTSTQDKSSPAS